MAISSTNLASWRGASGQEIADRKLDVGSGTFASNFVMYFIILTTALTLHKSGATQIETSQQAAEALRPLAGNFAAVLFTAGIIGTGLLAIPTLAGSAAYAFAETFAWRQGLDESLPRARGFYAVFVAAMAIGIAVRRANRAAPWMQQCWQGTRCRRLCTYSPFTRDCVRRLFGTED